MNTNLQPPRISIAIITKDRLEDLDNCLVSLKKQTALVDELVIIDSSKGLGVKQLLTRYKKIFGDIKYAYEPRQGFPFARNRAIHISSHQWIAFTDDDCVVDARWIEQIKQAIRKHPNAAAIAGLSKTLYQDSIVAQASELNELYWKINARNNATIVDLETLDNKNIVYNSKFLRRHSIQYDEKRADSYAGASDDCDLGMQIHQAGGKAFYNESMIVYHKDPTTLLRYLKGRIHRSAAHITYEQKWKEVRDRMPLTKTIGKWGFYQKYTQSHTHTVIQRVHLFGVLVCTYLIIRYVKARYVLSHTIDMIREYGKIVIFFIGSVGISKCIRGCIKIGDVVKKISLRYA